MSSLKKKIRSTRGKAKRASLGWDKPGRTGLQPSRWALPRHICLPDHPRSLTGAWCPHVGQQPGHMAAGSQGTPTVPLTAPQGRPSCFQNWCLRATLPWQPLWAHPSLHCCVGCGIWWRGQRLRAAGEEERHARLGKATVAGTRISISWKARVPEAGWGQWGRPIRWKGSGSGDKEQNLSPSLLLRHHRLHAVLRASEEQSLAGSAEDSGKSGLFSL